MHRLPFLSILVPSLFATFASATTPTARSNQCSVANIADCEALKRSEPNVAGQLGFPSPRDGSIFFNPYVILSRAQDGDLIHPFIPKDEIFLERMSASTPGRQRSALDLAERLRREAIEMVRGDVRNDQLSEAERKERDALIKRLETLQFKFVANEERKCSVEVPLGFPNAAYRAFTHSVEMCPALASQSNQMIARALAHELGHPMAPCDEKHDLFKVVAGKANRESLRDCSQDFVSGEDGSNSYMSPYAPFLRQLEEGALTHMSGDDEVLNTLASCGIISQVPDATPPGSKLFATTQTCIERQNATRYSRILESLTESNRSDGMSLEQARSTAMSARPERCFDRTVEHFADSFAAKLMDRFAEKERYSAQQAKAAFLDLAGLACSRLNGGFEDEFAYPPSDLRLRVLTSGRFMSSRLACEPPAARDAEICEFNSTALTQTAPTTAPKSTTPKTSARGAARR